MMWEGSAFLCVAQHRKSWLSISIHTDRLQRHPHLFYQAPPNKVPMSCGNTGATEWDMPRRSVYRKRVSSPFCLFMLDITRGHVHGRARTFSYGGRRTALPYRMGPDYAPFFQHFWKFSPFFYPSFWAFAQPCPYFCSR